MIFGIGVDQVDLNRVRKLLSKSQSKFEKRCFTENEVIYANRFADPSKRLGARFAGKEAVMKSLGKGGLPNDFMQQFQGKLPPNIN